MKKYTCVIVLISLLTACVTRQKCERKFPVHDSSVTSVNTITVIKDTTIYLKIPGDTVFQWVAVSDSSVSRLSTPLAQSSVWIKDGRLNHRLEQKDTILSNSIKGALQTTITELNQKEVLNQTEYINQLTWWQWLQVYLGRVFLGVMIVAVGSMIINRFIVKVRVF